ncbi:hypothetical protein GCM10018790_15880 [Kitasatospora xanthocidica]|uniref:hypothetical protein n=1 Tax=Kitasatospora xanthocidica TaxID=83382 RepID=UPI00167669D8|nr:hypothetical protein [Kitasatospora xanthocidica]GHF38909.1 hypothetical protein GCM10018790_15880 [Kitasatospora xanthocidica]
MGKLRLVRTAVVTAALLMAVAGCSSAGTAPVAASDTAKSSASTASSSRSPSPTGGGAVVAAVVYECGGSSVASPKYYLLACGNAGWWLNGLTWSDWGRETATATGQFWQRTCKPSCAEGGALPYPATVTAGGLTGGAYTTLRVTAPQAPEPVMDFGLSEKGAKQRTAG